MPQSVTNLHDVVGGQKKASHLMESIEATLAELRDQASSESARTVVIRLLEMCTTFVD